MKKLTTKKVIPLESEEQQALVEWLILKNIKHTSIPNSTYTTSWKQKFHNRAMGLNPGLPDLLICLPNKLLFLEMKRKGGKLSEYQIEWLEELNKYSGVETAVAYSFEEAKYIIKKIYET